MTNFQKNLSPLTFQVQCQQTHFKSVHLWGIDEKTSLFTSRRHGNSKAGQEKCQEQLAIEPLVAERDAREVGDLMGFCFGLYSHKFELFSTQTNKNGEVK